jgi:hypothetical protein
MTSPASPAIAASTTGIQMATEGREEDCCVGELFVVEEVEDSEVDEDFCNEIEVDVAEVDVDRLEVETNE